MLMNLSVRDKSIQKIAYKKLKSYTKKRIYNIVKGGRK